MVSWLISDNCFISLNTTGFRFLWPNHAYLIFFCTDNMLAFVCNKTGLFWALCRGKKTFSLFCFWIMLFSALSRETCFRSFAVKFCFFNVMTPRKGFLFSVARLYCLQRCRMGKEVFFFTNWRPNHAVFSFTVSEACFGLLFSRLRCFQLFAWKRFLYFAIKSGCLELYFACNKIFPFLFLNHAVLSFIAQ